MFSLDKNYQNLNVLISIVKHPFCHGNHYADILLANLKDALMLHACKNV